jgi:hypothetical protein
MGYSFDASNNPDYILNKDVDSDSNRFDAYEMYYLGKQYNIFAHSCADARKQAEEIYKKNKPHETTVSLG